MGVSTIYADDKTGTRRCKAQPIIVVAMTHGRLRTVKQSIDQAAILETYHRRTVSPERATALAYIYPAHWFEALFDRASRRSGVYTSAAACLYLFRSPQTEQVLCRFVRFWVVVTHSVDV